ncbi:MAG: CDP-glycerol glycerophosphotransferase family protein [Lachnospiraceae bacterium]|nr:CDP-glycerol glycerophosphotransferase family protein [Lachnospiraceae bacterium]
MSIRQKIKGLASEGMRKKYRKLRELIIKAEFRFFGLFKIEKEKVVFCNVWGYGDNPKWVARAYVKRLEGEIKEEKSASRREELKKRLDSIYFVTGQLPGELRSRSDRRIKFLKNNSFKANYELATAGIWVDCNRKESYINKRRGQFYIQTWHGSLPLKKIEGDCIDVLPEGYAEHAAHDTAMTDAYISNSDFCNEIYRRAFGFKGKIFCYGSPRMDILLKPDKERAERTKKQIISRINNKKTPGQDFKICLYAPTYREETQNFEKRGHGPEKAELSKALEKRFGSKFVFVSRLHPLAMSQTGRRSSVYLNLDNEEYLVNGNEFGDIYELMEAADVLITDYSNTLFEFAEAGKPVFLYAPDSKDYESSRGMYFDYKGLPYPIAASGAELCRKILNYDRDEYGLRQREFFEALAVTENGRASEKIARLIGGIIDKR